MENSKETPKYVYQCLGCLVAYPTEEAFKAHRCEDNGITISLDEILNFRCNVLKVKNPQ